MHLVALNQFLQFGFGDSRRGRGIDRVKLNLAAGEQVVLFLQELKKTRFHLQADGRERTGLGGHEADADRSLCIRANETEASEDGEQQGGDERSAQDILPWYFFFSIEVPPGDVNFFRADVGFAPSSVMLQVPQVPIATCTDMFERREGKDYPSRSSGRS
jgi:hypothetical protein